MKKKFTHSDQDFIVVIRVVRWTKWEQTRLKVTIKNQKIQIPTRRESKLFERREKNIRNCSKFKWNFLLLKKNKEKVVIITAGQTILENLVITWGIFSLFMWDKPSWPCELLPKEYKYPSSDKHTVCWYPQNAIYGRDEKIIDLSFLIIFWSALVCQNVINSYIFIWKKNWISIFCNIRNYANSKNKHRK